MIQSRWFWTIAAVLALAFSAGAQPAANWIKKSPPVSPPGREDHALAYDTARRQVVLFGGVGAAGTAELNDTWVWDGTNWTQKFPATVPPGRIAHAMAYDAAHQRVVMFGGVDAFGRKLFLGDTWLWDGSNWQQVFPQTSPPGLIGHAMAYDAARGQIVLFGGETQTAYVNDTWVWDGSNWSKKSPQTSPPARAGQMAYDSVHGQIVVFGGMNLDVLAFNDTWVWDGSNWIRKSPQTSPPARYGYSVAYDPGHAYVVLFGGLVFTGAFALANDTWVWDGSNWAQQSPQTNPPPRLNQAMAYDSVLGQLVMFGGFDSHTNHFDETWIWSGGASTPAIGGIVSASAFGAFSAVAPGSWVEIYGSNLAGTSRTWGAADFNGNSAPTSLDGVKVTIGGRDAFIDYISATQVNAQLPSGIATGSQQVVVSNGTVTSAPFNIVVNSTEPGLLAAPAFKIGTNQYVVALLSDGSYVLPAGVIPGVASRPAKPGETILLFGVGFGPVTPNIAAGQIATESNQLAQQLQISFGSAPAQLSYFGLAPGFVGLYQFNVVVPQVADNDLVPVTFNLGSAPGQQALFTTVRH